MLKTDTTKIFLPLGFLCVFVVLVQWLWGWGEVIRPWLALSWQAVCVAMGLMMLSYQLRTLRIYDYFSQDMRGHWWLSLKLVLIHNILNNLLPMRSGEVSFPLLMKRYFIIDYSRSVPALLWFRLLDLHTILALAMLSLVPADLPLAVSLLILLLWLCLPVMAYLLRNRLLLYVQGDTKGIKALLKKGLEGLPNSYWQFIKCWALTWMNWLLKIGVLVWVLSQFISLAFMTKLSAVIAGELTSVLPFHAPGGVGTYEVGIAAPLLLHAEAKEVMVAAINVHFFILSVAIIGGVVGYFISSSGKPEKQSEKVLC